MSELKPCPFCGESPSDEGLSSNGDSQCWVFCGECGAEGPLAKHVTEAFEYWNLRPSPNKE